MKTTTLLAVEKLDRWVSANGWAGYDPHDVKGTPFFLYLLDPDAGLALKVFRRPFLYAETYFPLLTRRIFQVPRTVNAKGMALFARGYLQLFRCTGDARYRGQALECLEWLSANRSAGFDEPCWGYPFDWQSGVLTPAGTPASVVSSAVCDAFWTAWEMLGDERYLRTCEGTCRFFLKHLNQDRMPDGAICFSYTPLDHFHVHNANLLIAELLVRVGKAAGHADWVDIGTRAGQYALNEQNEDGSIYYWGRGHDKLLPRWIDHYHSGFEIRCLHGLAQLTGREDFRRATDRYYAFYRSHLLERRDGLIAPKMTPSSFYPVNVHSCAEALLVNATLAAEYPDAGPLVLPIARWVVSRMQMPTGAYLYKLNMVLGRELPTRIPYLRWGQAWMLLALSQCLLMATPPDQRVGAR